MVIVPVATSKAVPACAGMDTEVFYQPSELRTALETCGECPVRMACLREELQHPITHQHGVRGGLTAGLRREILRAWRVAGYTLPMAPVTVQTVATVVELPNRRPVVESGSAVAA